MVFDFKFRYENVPFRCFFGDYGNLKVASRSYKGIKPISIEKIVGTVGRCHDIENWDFWQKTSRYHNIKQAMQNLKKLPPIKVYQVDDKYYIVDGHHRVLAGREIDKAFIDAEIIEYQFSGEKSQSDYHDCPMKDFEEETGLWGILLSSREKYEELKTSIKKFGNKLNNKLPLQRLADMWYKKVFLPFVEKNMFRKDNGKSMAEDYIEKVVEGNNEDTTGS